MPPKSKVKPFVHVVKKRIVIGIGGSGPGAGKDTVAVMLSSWLVKNSDLLPNSYMVKKRKSLTLVTERRHAK